MFPGLAVLHVSYSDGLESVLVWYSVSQRINMCCVLEFTSFYQGWELQSSLITQVALKSLTNSSHDSESMAWHLIQILQLGTQLTLHGLRPWTGPKIHGLGLDSVVWHSSSTVGNSGLNLDSTALALGSIELTMAWDTELNLDSAAGLWTLLLWIQLTLYSF